MSKKLLFRLFALVAAMMCALGMQAAVGAYANYTPSNTTLTFYYDNQRSSRTGTSRLLLPARRPPSIGSLVCLIFNPSRAWST